MPVTKKGKPDSTVKYFEAYFHVRIFSDSLQALGDSLFYSLGDSVFRLFKSPVVWAKDNQVTGDTIYLFIKNKKPERMFVFENAMAISKVDSSDFYNQVKSTTINALFEDGRIHFMRAKGNAENIYYGQDDQKKFIGVNKSSSDVIEIRFADSKPQRVTFLRNHEELKLRNFKWLDSIRPKSKFDILAY
jgi:hypothetical protein